MNQQDSAPDPHKDVEYEQWLREEVEAALAEGNHPVTEWMADDEVEKEMDELKRELEAMIAAQPKQ